MDSTSIARIPFGSNGPIISRLAFGTIPFGGRGWRGDPAVEPKEAGNILKRAHEFGITYWDTAENYHTHPHVREGLRRVRREKVVVSTKTGKKKYEEVKERVRSSLEELDTDYIDIYFLHYVNSWTEFKARHGALKALLEAKEAGLIRHIGISTHRAEVASAAADVPELEMVLATVNKTGKNMESPRDEMISALKRSYQAGKGVGVMKVLAYGDVTVAEGLEFSGKLPQHATLLGIRTMKELEEDVEAFLKVQGS